MKSNIYEELHERHINKRREEIKHVIVSTFLVLASLAFIVGLSVRLQAVDTKLGELVGIESEVRDANWIMACDDVPQSEAPITFKHCNEN